MRHAVFLFQILLFSTATSFKFQYLKQNGAVLKYLSKCLHVLGWKYVTSSLPYVKYFVCAYTFIRSRVQLNSVAFQTADLAYIFNNGMKRGALISKQRNCILKTRFVFSLRFYHNRTKQVILNDYYKWLQRANTTVQEATKTAACKICFLLPHIYSIHMLSINCATHIQCVPLLVSQHSLHTYLMGYYKVG